MLVILVMLFACSQSETDLLVNENEAGVLSEQANEFIDPAKPQTDTTHIDEELFFIVEEMPTFQGQSLEYFRDYIDRNLHYPESCKADGISGKVFVQFIVNSKGWITDVTVIRGVHPDLDAAALKVVKSSPQWEPGSQRGKKGSIQFTFPVVFSLE